MLMIFVLRKNAPTLDLVGFFSKYFYLNQHPCTPTL